MDIGQDIINAATDVFSTMLMIDLVVGEPVEGAGGEVISNITSLLGLGGDIRGMLAVHCPAAVATAITSAFLGIDVDSLNEDVKDAIGEIANMIAGNLKGAFAGYGVKVALAIPSAIIGESFRVGGMVGAKRVAVPFGLESGQFLVEFKYVMNN
jgi:chemotaxis protein CheX